MFLPCSLPKNDTVQKKTFNYKKVIQFIKEPDSDRCFLAYSTGLNPFKLS